MTQDEIIDGLLEREAGWRDAVPRPDKSWDPPTNHGITLDTLNANRDLLPYFENRPHPLQDTDLRELDEDMAGVIYEKVYIDDPGFTPANIPFEPLRVQLIDFGVNSGPERAVRWLQRVMRVPVTGVMDAETRQWLLSWAKLQDRFYPILNDALVAARSYMIDAATDHGSMRKEDEEGVESRALSFFLARP